MLATIHGKDSASLRVKEFKPNYASPFNIQGRKGSQDYCCLCFRNIRGVSKYAIHVIAGGTAILHSSEESNYISDGGDLCFLSVGSDCAKKLGLEWCHTS